MHRHKNLQLAELEYFKELFSSPVIDNPNILQVPLHSEFSREGRNILTASVNKDEVRRAVFSMKSFKAPGPDGFQPIFFKHFWDVVGDYLWRLVESAFDRGYSDMAIAEILIMFIPKIDHPRHLKEFRPISLCNVVYKVIMKVLVQRMRPFLDEFIGPLRSSFITGRSTLDNAILAQEVIHYMHYSKASKGIVAFRIDLEKAYDKVSWKILLGSLTFLIVQLL